MEDERTARAMQEREDEEHGEYVREMVEGEMKGRKVRVEEEDCASFVGFVLSSSLSPSRVPALSFVSLPSSAPSSPLFSPLSFSTALSHSLPPSSPPLLLQAARDAEHSEKEKAWSEKYDREAANWKAEVKGENALKKLQREELEELVRGHKRVKKEWRSARFDLKLSPSSPGTMNLHLKLPGVFTTSVSVDPKKRAIAVAVTGNEVEVPLALIDCVGSLNMDPVEFKADLKLGRSQVRRLGVEGEEVQCGASRPSRRSPKRSELLVRRFNFISICSSSNVVRAFAR